MPEHLTPGVEVEETVTARGTRWRPAAIILSR